MAETVNKAQISEEIAKKILKYFHWNVVSPSNIDFKCSRPITTEDGNSEDCHSVKTNFPVDDVYYYVDPYLGKGVYINTDFKNYSIASITPSKIRNALNSLAETIACAKRSSEW